MWWWWWYLTLRVQYYASFNWPLVLMASFCGDVSCGHYLLVVSACLQYFQVSGFYFFFLFYYKCRVFLDLSFSMSSTPSLVLSYCISPVSHCVPSLCVCREANICCRIVETKSEHLIKIHAHGLCKQLGDLAGLSWKLVVKIKKLSTWGKQHVKPL